MSRQEKKPVTSLREFDPETAIKDDGLAFGYEQELRRNLGLTTILGLWVINAYSYASKMKKEANRMKRLKAER